MNDLTEIIETFQRLKKKTNAANKLLTEISTLDKDRLKNIPKIRVRLSKLRSKSNEIEAEAKIVDVTDSWCADFEKRLGEAQEGLKKRFGSELGSELKRLGLSLTGQYPVLSAGLFSIELDFEGSRVVIWYGPKQERLDTCRLEPSEVRKKVEALQGGIGSGLAEADCVAHLEEALRRAGGGDKNEPVPIARVLSEVAFLVQSPKFHGDPRKENYRSYHRADFSYDLFRCRRRALREGIQMVVATRAYTRRRKDSLWIPNDLMGGGTMISHLKIGRR